MPNPRVGTVTPNVGQAVKDAKGGAIEFRAEKAGIVHAGVGKASFTDEALDRQRQGPGGRPDPRQAVRRQGDLHQAHQPLLDHGPRLQGRCGEHRGLGFVEAGLSARSCGAGCGLEARAPSTG